MNEAANQSAKEDGTKIATVEENDQVGLSQERRAEARLAQRRVKLHADQTRQHLQFTLTFLLFVLTDLVILLFTTMVLLKWVSALIVAGGAVMLLFRQHKLMEGEARALEEHLRFLAAAESTLDDFYIFDAVYDGNRELVDFRFAYINPNAERRLKVQRNSLIGKSLKETRPFVVTSGLFEQYKQVVESGAAYSTEVFIDDEMIQSTWIHVQAVRLGDGIAITSRNITESKRMAEHVSYLAHHDHLTGLPNRMLLQDRLGQALLRAQRSKKKVAVFMLDIDNFKNINDTLGHAEGDALLIAMARRLLTSVRESDTVARLGGDEFVILMTDFTSLEEVKRSGRLLVESAARPILIDEKTLNITISAGVCIYPDAGQDLDELLKNADQAMYTVKRSGRNGLHLYKTPAQLQAAKAASAKAALAKAESAKPEPEKAEAIKPQSHPGQI